MGKAKTSRNSTSSIKRLIGNRNTVTILGVLACIVTLIIGYNTRVKNAISPITVPYAKESIPARTLITNNMVGYIKISSSYVSDSTNLLRNTNEVVGRYSSYKTAIPVGSLFYSDSVIDANEMPDYAFSDISKGSTIFSLDVTATDTYANEIRAGDYIDLYMSTTDPDQMNKVIYSKFIESIRVLAVKDSKGNNIVKNTLAYGTPSELLFVVDNKMFSLLMKSQLISPSVKLVPIIRNHKYTEAANETKVSYENLEKFITDRAPDLWRG